ncbi:MAG: hypothetical protein EAZ57_10630 [Cytophagales bacterium]|nr:MAG: hypothetical protein EAZ67_10905 [Cytophagales bacterium]TAF59611.1 MAG: hypothetical protein EAZ57_10630 [Cytophagales bacterium]
MKTFLSILLWAFLGALGGFVGGALSQFTGDEHAHQIFPNWLIGGLLGILGGLFTGGLGGFLLRNQPSVKLYASLCGFATGLFVTLLLS